MTPGSPLDEQKLQAARLWLTQRFPYLAMALHSTVLRPVAGLGTFAVDRSWRLYVDPACVDSWSVEQVGAVLVHEVWHLLRDHADRCDRAGAADRPRAWNAAADAEINDDLVAAGLPLPGSPVLPRTIGMPDGLLAEQYLDGLPPERTTDCGSGAGGRRRAHEDGPPSDGAPGLQRVQGELVRIATAKEVADVARVRGSVPGGWERWAADLLTPKVDWRSVLSGAVRRSIAGAGQDDYAFTRPSRRAAATPGIVAPALRRSVPVVAVVLDTSASVDDDLLAQAVTEVDGALRSGGRAGVTVLTCDAAAGAAQRIRSVSSLRLSGGGGTDLRVGVDAALSLRPRPGVVIVLTDGWTPWPAAPVRGCRLVVALLEPGAPPPPWWTTVVRAHDGP